MQQRGTEGGHARNEALHGTIHLHTFAYNQWSKVLQVFINTMHVTRKDAF